MGAEAVKGIIEVKADLSNTNLRDVIMKMNNAGKFIFEAKKNKSSPIFNGIFSYGGFEGVINCPGSIRRSTINAKDSITGRSKRFFIVNQISFNKDLFLKFWHGQDKFSLYKLKDLSFSYFISNLLYFITDKYIDIEHESGLWFPEDKERRKICDL